jgi:cytochrome c-type biogenesis protein CcmH
MRFPKLLALYVLLVLFQATLYAASTPDLDDRTREIATELRCVVCQNLSVADSPSEMAQQMRAIVREQIQAGKTPDQIKDFFVSKYGEWVLLKPKTTGVSALLWILPYVVLILGIVAALWFVHRWVKKKNAGNEPFAKAPLSEQTRSAFMREDFALPDIEDSSPRAQLLRERSRLRDELKDLEFDFQSGKLSESDYGSLKQDIESKAVAVIQQVSALPPESAVKTPTAKSSRPGDEKTSPTAARLKRWQLIGGGVFLMLFGLALGVMLTKSIRSRAGENDTMTGDFLTGTSPANSEAGAALAEGKQAFGRQEYPKAIEAFKKVLAADPNNPEAHSYMGFILMQAGHGEGAMMAFEKALSQAPNFPMALWGKGMVLYQDKQDFAGARAIFEQLLNLMPPGEERNEVTKILAEIPASGSAPKPAPAATSANAATGQTISGKITVDPKLKDKIDPQAALFIIARSGSGASGPPLAVKKIDKPTFPLDYSLSQENVMMQGTPFTGKINIIVRLDKDGNPTTRTPGDMTGEYKKNPVEAGAKNVDIVIDQALQ